MPTLDLAVLLHGGPKCSVTCNGKPAWFGGKVSAAAPVPVGGVISQGACAATCCEMHECEWPWCISSYEAEGMCACLR